MACTLNDSQKLALQLYESGKNIFLSGPAGTGKSYIIDKIIHADHKIKAITASTGIAAVLISGSTLHSFAGIGLGTKTMRQIIHNLRPDVLTRWKELDVLIIDEVSMINAEYFDKLNSVVKLIRQTDNIFGGIQLVLSGDFLQLPPINSKFTFQADAWLKSNMQVVEFTKSMRQNDEFFTILNKIRVGQINNQVIRYINNAVRRCATINDIIPTKLYPTRDSVFKINISELKKLMDAGAKYKLFTATVSEKPNLGTAQKPEYMAKIWGQVQCMENFPCAVGAQVMLTKNLNVAAGLANGSRGIVIDVGQSIKVQFLNGVHEILPDTFEVQQNKSILCITQFPLLLAWATTIHKSQGMTLDLVEMDLSQSFEYGMIYVALSRVRSMDGLYINKIDYRKIKAHPDALKYYNI